MSGYVIAISRKEAEELALDCPELVHNSMQSAATHLAEVKAPPTDPYYANQYKIYSVKSKAAR